LHRARKAYKRARYAAEALAPLAPRPGRRLGKRLAALQDTLGTHQDAIVTCALLREHGMLAFGEGENAFTYGLLHARQHKAGEQVLDELRRLRRRAGKRGIRRWLLRT
jgi:CHAD domain-containing protein